MGRMKLGKIDGLDGMILWVDEELEAREFNVTLIRLLTGCISQPPFVKIVFEE